MKMSAATRPTNAAATSSMESMKRSISRRPRNGMVSSRGTSGAVCRLPGRRTPPGSLDAGLVLLQALLEPVEHGARIVTGLAHVVRPLHFGGGYGLAPRGQLPGIELVNRVPAFRGQLGAPAELEIRPR